ncbi:MAG: hypothetical protein RIR00_1826 [Pseudomonadota bacterium]
MTLRLALLLCGFCGVVNAATPLDALLQAARAANPDWQAAQLDAAAAAEKIEAAGALPDPLLRIELENLTRNGSQSPTLAPGRVGDSKYSLLQPLPFWGKRDLRQELASRQAELARGRAGETWADTAARIKNLYTQHWLDSQSRRLGLENIALTERLEQIAHTRYASGLAPQQDAIRAQVERTGLESELLALDSELQQLRAGLNALLARPVATPLPETDALPPLPAPLDAAALKQRLFAGNPLWQQAEAGVGGAETSRDLVYRNRYPDFTVGVVPMQVQSRVESWSLMFEMNLPLQQASRRSQEREVERQLEAAQARRNALRHRLESELDAILAGLESARLSETLNRQRLLPQAELSFQAALAGYENGQVDFATLLDAQRQIRAARLALLKARASQQLRLADLERLLGEPL